MQLNKDITRLVRVGTAPVLLEHIQVSLTIKRKEKTSVYVLDHGANRTNFTGLKKIQKPCYEIVYE